MKIKVRHVDEAVAVDFCDGIPDQQDILRIAAMIDYGGGFYFAENHHKFHSYQFVIDHDGAYCELVFGEEGK